MTRFIAFLVLLITATGCSYDPLVRDDYFGRAWLEPDRGPKPVQRDGMGNPILPAPNGRQEGKPTT